MQSIPDFTEAEHWVVESTLKERYRDAMPELQPVEVEVRLNPLSTQLTACPALYWLHEGCHFLVVKTREQTYRAQFFFRVHQQFGTGIEEFDNITDCVVTLLQVQADHVAKQAAEGAAHAVSE